MHRKITDSMTVGQIATAYPHLIPELERLGIDYCCGGSHLLADAVERIGMEPSEVFAHLSDHVPASPAGPSEVDYAAMTMTELADHIEQTHHTHARKSLTRLERLLTKCVAAHSDDDLRLTELQDTVARLTEDCPTGDLQEQRVLRRFPGGQVILECCAACVVDPSSVNQNRMQGTLRILTGGQFIQERDGLRNKLQNPGGEMASPQQRITPELLAFAGQTARMLSNLQIDVRSGSHQSMLGNEGIVMQQNFPPRWHEPLGTYSRCHTPSSMRGRHPPLTEPQQTQRAGAPLL